MSFFSVLVNIFSFVFARLYLSHGGSIEFDSVGVVDYAVKDGIGEGGFANNLVPLVDRELAGNQDRCILVPIFDDFHEIPSLVSIESIRPPVIQDQQIGFDQSPEQARVASVCTAHFQFRKHPGDALV